MITNHIIESRHNEEILCLYFDYNYEIGKFNTNKRLSLKEQITNYINERKIKFHGKKVAIIVSGVVVAVFTINQITLNNTKNEGLNNSDLIFSEVVIPEQVEIKEEEENVQEEADTADDQSEVSSTAKASTKTNTQTTTTSKTEVPKEQPAPPVQNKTRINVYRSSGQVLSIELEEYLIGVVGAEMPASFNTEALKAQAIISRTYALKRISEGKQLTDTVSTQVYKDNEQLKANWGGSYSTYYNKVKQAVNLTEGLVITYNGSIIDAVFHSTSNGYTADSVTVWGNNIPYLKSVASLWDKNVSSYLGTTTKEFSVLSSILGFDFNNDTVIEILNRDISGRVSQIKVSDTTYTGVQFRTLFNLRSADFDIALTSNGVEIITRGYGHGVGLSQYGANEMSKLGYSYHQILTHYYTGVSIVKR